MNYKLSIRVSTIDKTILFFIIVGLLTLSFHYINNGFMRRLDEDVTSSSSGFLFLFSLVFVGYYLFKYRSSKPNVFWGLFWGYFVLAYLMSTSFSLKNLFDGVCLTFWMFCYAFGKRLTDNVNNVVLFCRAITLIVIIPLSVYCLYVFLSTDLYINQDATDAFFLIMVYMPFVLLMGEKRLTKLLLYIVFLVLAVISFKRSIIIAFTACSIVYMLLISHKKLYSKWYFWALLIVLYFLVKYFLGYISDTLLFRFSNIAEDGGSGRDMIYERIFDALRNSDVISFFLGHGVESARNMDLGNRLAHNDWLELLYDLGFLGCFMYISFLLSLVKTMIKTRGLSHSNKTIFAASVSSFVFYIILALFNCCIYSKMIISPIMLSLGICKGLLEKPAAYMQFSKL